MKAAGGGGDLDLGSKEDIRGITVHAGLDTSSLEKGLVLWLCAPPPPPPVYSVYTLLVCDGLRSVHTCSHADLSSCQSVLAPMASCKPQVCRLCFSSSGVSVMQCLCYTAQHLPCWHPSLVLLPLQEVRSVTSHQPSWSWDKWGINSYWLGKLPQDALPFPQPVLPQRPSIESRWPCLLSGAQHTGHV